VLLADGDRSVRLLSYDLSLSELTRLAAGVTRTDIGGWIGAGGVIN
jgi:hypothetical protein